MEEDLPIVLFISQRSGRHADTETTYCGIGIRGQMTGRMLESPRCKYEFITCFVQSNAEIESYILRHQNRLIGIIYNFHSITTPWLTDSSLRAKYSNLFHVMIHYDITQQMVHDYHPAHYHGFEYVITDNYKLDLTQSACKHFYVVARSVPMPVVHITKEVRAVPWIGFQGFGFPHKGIHRIAEYVVKEFDEAVIRLHMPYSLFGDPSGAQAHQRVAEIKNIIAGKPGIQLDVSHDFKSEEDVVLWLSENDINCYFLDHLPNSGLASSPDYALAARRPIAVSRSYMLRHFWDLGVEVDATRGLKDIMHAGIDVLQPLYDIYGPEKVRQDYVKVVDDIMHRRSAAESTST